LENQGFRAFRMFFFSPFWGRKKTIKNEKKRIELLAICWQFEASGGGRRLFFFYRVH
jgi:hypothetical protein